MHDPADISRWERLKRYPELALLCFSLMAVGAGCALRLPLSPPDLTSGQVILQEYILPLTVAIVVHLVLLIRLQSRRGSSAIVLGLSIPTLLVVTYCHFQCKVWMPLIHPHRFGAIYESVDHAFSPIVAGCGDFVRLMERAGLNVSAAYHGWFIVFFFICFGLHALYDTTNGQRQVILGVGWILALGGVGYWIAPAVGPFIYRHGVDSHATLVQSHMWEMYHVLVLTRRVPDSYFLMPPAAMPSLHIAHVAFFVWMMRRISRPLSLFFFPVLLWFMVTAVGLAWHYLLDLPAGLLLAAIAVVLVKKMLPDLQTIASLQPLRAEVVRVAPEIVEEPVVA